MRRFARLLCQVRYREGDGVEHVTEEDAPACQGDMWGHAARLVLGVSVVCQRFVSARAPSVHSCSA